MLFGVVSFLEKALSGKKRTEPSSPTQTAGFVGKAGPERFCREIRTTLQSPAKNCSSTAVKVCG